jgi:hypothetical protein
LLGGIALLGVLPTLPWWLGLALVPWLQRDERPAARLVGAGWILLTILTPFYHPYARLMLPMQAFCWLIAAGLVGEILVNARLDDTRSWPMPIVSARGIALTVSVVVALGYGSLIEPRAVPYPALLGPSDSLRRVAKKFSAGLSVRNEPISVAVYARPPLAFYLTTVHGLSVSTLSAFPHRVDPRHDWTLIDEVQCFGDPRVARSWTALRGSEESYGRVIGITTLLDVDPLAAYGKTSLGESMTGQTDWRPGQYTEFEPPVARIIEVPRRRPTQPEGSP